MRNRVLVLGLAFLLMALPGFAGLPGTPETELLCDRFDKLNKADWWVARGSWNNAFGQGEKADYTGVMVQDGTMTLKADKTDRVGVLYSKPVAVSRDSLLIFRRRVKIHFASRSFGGAFEVFGVDDPTMNANKPAISSHLFGVTYQNTNYQTDLNCIALLTGANVPKGPGNYAGGQAPSVPGIWDTWFDEEIQYDATTGETVYRLNGNEVMRVVGAPLTAKYVKVMMHAYGWGTGHSTVMDSFEFLRRPLREEHSGTTPPNMGCTGLPPISFPPPDSSSAGTSNTSSTKTGMQTGDGENAQTGKDRTGDAGDGGKQVKDWPDHISRDELPSLEEEKTAVAELVKRFQAAAQSRDANAAAGCFLESVREKYQKAFGEKSEKLPDLARALENAGLTGVGPGFMDGGHAWRHGALTFTVGGKSYEASLIRVDQTWFFEQL